ncbi:hypothetical protein EYF80_041438 [Liparis tanakae]|uniref:Uncharacterized protein n=1 Tax=Liparis tanakae TaxID=230148 RepID=A0A4Z2G4A9_9TELE|nr:hypothetical protein EYF80_041438 [Liparis tanakae]
MREKKTVKVIGEESLLELQPEATSLKPRGDRLNSTNSTLISEEEIAPNFGLLLDTQRQHKLIITQAQPSTLHSMGRESARPSRVHGRPECMAVQSAWPSRVHGRPECMAPGIARCSFVRGNECSCTWPSRLRSTQPTLTFLCTYRLMLTKRPAEQRGSHRGSASTNQQSTQLCQHREGCGWTAGCAADMKSPGSRAVTSAPLSGGRRLAMGMPACCLPLWGTWSVPYLAKRESKIWRERPAERCAMETLQMPFNKLHAVKLE